MIRSSRGDNAGRTFRVFARGTIEKVSDKPQMQEVDVNLLQDETKQGIERWQNYGVSSVPLGPSGKKYAEALVAFLGGNRSHGVVLGIDDRRHRPKELKGGEVVLYDDQKQQVHLSRDGIRIKGGDGSLPIHIDVGGTQFRITKDSITLTSPKIILDGTVYIGGADASKEIAMKGSIDSSGDIETSNLATKAFVK